MPTRLNKHARRGDALPGIAFVLDDADLTGLGDEEIPAGHPKIRPAKFLPQILAGLHGQAFGIFVVRRFEIFAEQLRDRRHILMNDRRDEMARPVLPDLNDEFAQVGFNYFESGVFHRVSQLDFLTGHRLALDASAAVARAGDFENDPPGVRTGGGEVDMPAVGTHLRGKLFQIIIKMIERMLLDRPCQLSQSV